MLYWIYYISTRLKINSLSRTLYLCRGTLQACVAIATATATLCIQWSVLMLHGNKSWELKWNGEEWKFTLRLDHVIIVWKVNMNVDKLILYWLIKFDETSNSISSFRIRSNHSFSEHIIISCQFSLPPWQELASIGCKFCRYLQQRSSICR